MSLITLSTVTLKEVIESPEFTEEGLLLPLEYFEIYEKYYTAVICELELRGFDSLVKAISVHNIGPSQGFAVWIGEATLVTWVLSLKLGHTCRAFYPASVAANIVDVTQSMFVGRAVSGAIH